MSEQDLEPEEVAQALERSEILLIDVREQAEFDDARIEGAVLFPLSAFDPAKLPDAGGKEIVFHCGVGIRSAKAIQACERAGVMGTAHMRGGIQAWEMAGLPVVSGT